MRVNPLDHAAAIKQLFVAHGRPEFPEYFDRAFPDVVTEGGTSWVGWDKQGRLSAHIAQFPREFVFNGRRVRGALLANLMVATEHRKFWPALALARRVVKDVTESGSADFLYADPNEHARPVLLGAGLREIGVLRRCVLPLTDGRQGIALGLRFYHLLQRLRTTPLVGIERLTGEPDGVAEDRFPCGDQGTLRPLRRRSLYRARLPGYPRANDRWFTFHRRGRETTPVGEALARGPDKDGVAIVCVVQCAVAHLSSLLINLGHCLARAGATRLEIWIMDESQAAIAVRRAGFLGRPESVSVVAQPLTALGAEAMAAPRDWQFLALDLDR